MSDMWIGFLLLIYSICQFIAVILYCINWDDILDKLNNEITLLDLIVGILTLPGIILCFAIILLRVFFMCIVNVFNEIKIYKRKK